MLRCPEFFYANHGTVYVFFTNLGNEAIGIQNGFMNEVPLSNQETFLWHRISPNPIPPTESGELVVQLRKPPAGLSELDGIQLRLLTTKGEDLSTSIPLVNHPFLLPLSDLAIC